MIEPFLTVREAIEILKVTERTIYTMIKDGRLSAYKPNTRLLIPREAVERLLERSMVNKK